MRAVIRGEELDPPPEEDLRQALARYPEVEDICWVQEEPWNQGAWHYILPIMENLLGPDRTLRYIGRDEMASPATGSYQQHLEEEREFVRAALHRPGETSGHVQYFPLRDTGRAAG
jgi:2-oxoglutarate dehydrogenase E1 component